MPSALFQVEWLVPAVRPPVGQRVWASSSAGRDLSYPGVGCGRMRGDGGDQGGAVYYRCFSWVTAPPFGDGSHCGVPRDFGPGVPAHGPGIKGQLMGPYIDPLVAPVGRAVSGDFLRFSLAFPFVWDEI